MTPSDPVIEQQHKTRFGLRLPSGRTVFLPVTIETSTIDPTTGARTLFIDEHHYRTADGRNVKPSDLAECTNCQHLIAPQATSYCEHCQAVLCRDCAQQPPRCAPCRKKDRRKKIIERCKEVIEWVASL